ncbi:hypothetical protein FACS189413_06150 [Bacteroidia bacterium]|nr:hypothetical protein FACS189413_06150 [Bacteroidia bacterium]
MKKRYLLSLLIFYTLGLSAQTPLTNAPAPLYPAKDVTSFFSRSYSQVTAFYDLAVSWGAPARWEITPLDDATEALKITNLGWMPLGLKNQVNISDKTYLHLDVYSPMNVASFQVGFHYFGHAGAGEEKELYAPEIIDLKAGEWYSIDYPLIVFSDQGYNLKGINVLRFRSNTGTIPELYIGNLYAFNGEPDNLLDYHTPNNDPRLKSLTVSEGTLTPAFDAALFVYTVDVPAATTSITIDAEAFNEVSTITGTGEQVLAIGSNVFVVQVTAENGTKLPYKITVNRRENAGIRDLNPETAVRISSENGILQAQFEEKAAIRLYDIRGRVIHSAIAENEYRRALPPGLYILSVNGNTHKVLIPKI